MANGHRNVAKHLLEKTDKTALTVTDHKVRKPSDVHIEPLTCMFLSHFIKGRMGLHYAAAIADHDDRGMYDWLKDDFSADDGQLDKVL